MIYIRRIKAPWWRARQYQLRIDDQDAFPLARAEVYDLLLDRYRYGVGDTWALILEADRACKVGDDRWVSL